METLSSNETTIRGLTGLTNLGNTCFLNSCLQILKYTHELNDILQKKTPSSKHPDSIMHKEWNELNALLWSNNGVVSPNKFVHHVQQLATVKQREMFTGWAQNDMPEFLLFMVECFHNSIARKIKMRIKGTQRTAIDKRAVTCYEMLQTTYEKEYSEVMDLFYAVYVSELSSGSKIHTIKPELFFICDLPIPIPTTPTQVTLYDCFDQFVLPEQLTGDNAWYNETEKRTEDVEKRITFWNLPKILVITLKRFCPYGQHKINTLIDAPLHNLNLSKYVSGYNPQRYVYDLYGICNHHGGVHGGHYTATVKDQDGTWTHYNDTHYQVVQDTSTLITPHAYCLFYRIQHK